MTEAVWSYRLVIMKTINASEFKAKCLAILDEVAETGEVLTMDISSGGTFQCEVVRSDWHHEKNMFVIACRYAKRSISFDEYQAFIDSSDWQQRALL